MFLLVACPDFYYGSGCSKECDCHPHHASGCDPEDGSCICKPGHQGDRCQDGKINVICHMGRGQRGGCDPEDGSCICKPRHQGDRCQDGKTSAHYN